MAKGTVWDLFTMSLLLFVFAIGVLVGHYVIAQVTTTMSSPSAAAASVLANATAAMEVYNYGFLMIFVSLAGGAIIFAYMTPQNPIFFVVSMILMVVLMIVVPIYSNAYEQFIADPLIATSASSFGIMTYIFGNFPLFMASIGSLIMIVSYIRWRNQGTI